MSTRGEQMLLARGIKLQRIQGNEQGPTNWIIDDSNTLTSSNAHGHIANTINTENTSFVSSVSSTCSSTSFTCSSPIDGSDIDHNYTPSNDESVSADDNDKIPIRQSASMELINVMEVSPKIKSRNRARNLAHWKRNTCKRLRNTDKEYITLSKGKLISARKVLPPCSTR
ncbi:unnamed protein product [Diabrotica balteata]|uniref:Uncharacterized protein n=1 Tax=Diabrotica balteata TaxID=107213 RepID=A0A9N9X6W8_DIABA|nr:unnamed protein product [Diabrotica balteata]